MEPLDPDAFKDGYSTFGAAVRVDTTDAQACQWARQWAAEEGLEFARGGEPRVISRYLIQGAPTKVRFVVLVARRPLIEAA